MIETSLNTQNFPLPDPPLSTLPGLPLQVLWKRRLKDVDGSIANIRADWVPEVEEQYSYSLLEGHDKIQRFKNEIDKAKKCLLLLNQVKKDNDFFLEAQKRLDEAETLYTSASHYYNSLSFGYVVYFSYLISWGLDWYNPFFFSLFNEESIKSEIWTVGATIIGVAAVATRIETKLLDQQLKIYEYTKKLQEENFDGGHLCEAFSDNLKNPLKEIDQCITIIRDRWEKRASQLNFHEKKEVIEKLESAIKLAEINLSQFHLSEEMQNTIADLNLRIKLKNRINEASTLCRVSNLFNYFQRFKKWSVYIGISAFSILSHAQLSKENLQLATVAAASIALGIIVLDPLFPKYLNRQLKLYELTKEFQEKHRSPTTLLLH